jgi:hypothetical protein
MESVLLWVLYAIHLINKPETVLHVSKDMIM